MEGFRRSDHAIALSCLIAFCEVLELAGGNNKRLISYVAETK